MESKTYQIVKSEKSPHGGTPIETVVQDGLLWAIADTERNRLQSAENAAHPERSSWTKTLFIVRMEKSQPTGEV